MERRTHDLKQETLKNLLLKLQKEASKEAMSPDNIKAIAEAIKAVMSN
jgi:hypothetical protein